MSAKRKSDIWKCFLISRDNPSFAICKDNRCNSVISRGTSAKHFSTKPLWNHVKYKHREKYKTLTMRKVHVDIASHEGSIVEHNDNNYISKIKVLQQTTTQDSQHRWDVNDSSSIALTKQLCEFIALDGESYDIVQGRGFRKFISVIAPQYVIPPKSHFSDIAMPALYDLIKIKLQKKLDTAKFISFTTNVWTNSMNISYVALYASFINDDISFERCALKFQHFTNIPSNNDIEEFLRKTIQEWNIDEGKFHVLLKKNAPLTCSGVGTFRFRNSELPPMEVLPCAVNTLQLVVQDAIFSQPMNNGLVSKCKNIVDHFSNSSSNNETYRKIENSLEIHGVLDDKNLSWNSTFNMLRRLFELRSKITTYSDEDGEIPRLTTTEWTLVDKITKVLMPIDEITKMCSKEKEVISCVIPVIQALHSYLGKEKKDDETKPMKDLLKKSLDTLFLADDKNIQNIKPFVLASVLDPRFKINFIQNVEQAKEWLMQEMTTLNKLTSDLSVKNDTTNDDTSSDPLGNTDLVMDCYDISENDDEPISKIENLFEDNFDAPNEKESYEDELNKYLKIPLVKKDSDPMLWWKRNEMSFPNLKSCMIKYLSAPPALCSESKNDKVQKFIENGEDLTPDKAEIVMFVMHNANS